MPEYSTVACAALLCLGLMMSFLFLRCSPSGRPVPDARPRCIPAPSLRRRNRRVSFSEPYDPAMRSDLQRQALQFSEVLITDDLRAETKAVYDDATQLQKVNDRFEEAKRNVVEHRLKPGVYGLKQRRKLIENLLRRPYCGRRVRSWRTENSDFMRGDVRPRATNGSSNVIRSAKNNPDVDLHPGALGPMAGMNGLWNSEENVPGNVVPDAFVYEGVSRPRHK